ncbi:aminotransferase class IV, partial [Pontiella sp.]|uniref:aminotransferase class IV n=1 Tax=Pontiella sp. TaxID=2837462 RepID=UPI0035655AA0
LETMLWEPESGIYLLDEHLQRLGKSAAYFDIPLDMHAVFQALDRKYHTCASVKIRLLVSMDGNMEVQTFPVDAAAAEERPVLRAALAEDPVNPQDVFLYHKTTHRDVYASAKAAFPNHDEVILWNERGEVTEGTFTNVVVSRGGKRITPPVECGLLAGTFREHLLKSGDVEEGILLLEDLRSADEVWLVNSVRKWQKAVLEVLDESDC